MSTEGFDNAIDDLVQKCLYAEAAKAIAQKYPEDIPERYQLTSEIACLYEKKKQEVLDSETDPQWSEQYHSSKNEKHQRFARFNCMIDRDLLPSVLAVMNETDLYHTWMPSYKFPFRLGLRTSKIWDIWDEAIKSRG